MFTYKIKTADLTPYLPKMQAVQRQDNLSELGLDVDTCQPLRRSIPCGLRIRAAREGYGMEMGTVRCGIENINLGSTELCDACYAVFKDVSTNAPENAHLTMEQMEESAETKPLSLIERCKKFAKDHPYLTAAALTFPVVFTLMAYRTSSGSTTNTRSNYSVGVKQNADVEKTEVIVTTKAVAPANCYDSELVYSANGKYTGERVTNKCKNSLLVTAMGKGSVPESKSCIVESGQTKVCLASSTNAVYHSGYSHIKFTAPRRDQPTHKIKARVTNQGRLTINLNTAPRALNCIKAGQSSYINTCEKPILLSMISSNGKIARTLVQPRENRTLPSGDKLTLRENSKLPKVTQKPAFV